MKRLLFLFVLFIIPVIIVAQIVTVAKIGSPTYSTVQAAIDSFDPDPDAGVPNVIQITDSSVYDEMITVDVPVTIEGTGASRPVLAVKINSGGDANDGLLITIPTGTFNGVTLRNLIIIPSTTTPPTDDAVRSAGQNLNILLDNVLITPNNGSDAPVTIDGLTEVSLVGCTVFGDDGAFLGGGAAPAGDGTLVTMVNTVISHNNNAAGNDGLVASGGITGTGGFIIQDGCVFSFNGRLGIQSGSSLQINAPTKRVIVLGNKGFAGIWFAGVGSAVSPVRTLDGVDVLNNGTSTISGWGIEQQNGGSVPFSLTNSIIAGNTSRGLLIGEVGTDGLITVENVTIANNGTSAIETNAAHTGLLSFTDCVIAGNGTADPLNSILHNGTGAMSISYSAIVTAGPFALTGTGTSGTGTINQSNVINNDPLFIQTVNFQVPEFYDVTAVAYAGAGSGGSDLGGGADYAPPTAVHYSWSLYE